jgi:tRNA(Ser,Leu) C12 N-acetylase TAN1
MTATRVKALTEEILRLPEPEREELAQAVLPVLLTTPAGLAGIDEALRDLADSELEALVERARRRGRGVSDATVAEVIGEALRAVRAPRRP